MNSKSFRKDGWWRYYKEWRRRRPWRLRTRWRRQWRITYSCQGKKGTNDLLTRGGVPTDPDRGRHAQGRMTPTLPPSMRAVHSLIWSQNGRTRSHSRRHAQPFLLSHCRSDDNRTYLPGTLCNSGRKGPTRSVQSTRWAKTRNSSRSQNLAPNSNASELLSSTSRANPREDPKQSPSLVPETEKGQLTQEGREGPYDILGQTVLRPSVYVNLQPWGLT